MYDQEEMQCASSTTSSRTRLASEVDWSSVRKSEENTFSGDMKRTFSTPDWSNETAWTSVCGRGSREDEGRKQWRKLLMLVLHERDER